MPSFFSQDVLDEILDLIELVSEGFLTYSYNIRADFSDQFRKDIMRYKRIGYNINVKGQFACLVINPITVGSFASLFNCTPDGRASDSMMGPT